MEDERQIIDNKVVFVGDIGVGKTSIIKKYCTGEFSPDYQSTIGACQIQQDVQLPSGKIVHLSIWDTAGQERYQSLIPLYLRNVKGVILVADVTRDDIIPTLNIIHRSLSNVDTRTPTILVANKIDSYQSLDFTELEKWGKDRGMVFLPASAKTGVGISEIFQLMGTMILEMRDEMDHKEKLRKKNSGNLCC